MVPSRRWASLAHLAQYLMHQQEWMPLHEAARLYRVTPDTMQAWVRQGKFSAKELDDDLWIARAELYSALRQLPNIRSDQGRAIV